MIRGGESDEAIISAALPEAADWPRADLLAIRSQIKYAGYLKREAREADRLRKAENQRFPTAFDFDAVHGLRIEIRQLLREVQPTSVGQAARIPGVTPAALALLAAALDRRRQGRERSSGERSPVSRVAR